MEKAPKIKTYSRNLNYEKQRYLESIFCEKRKRTTLATWTRIIDLPDNRKFWKTIELYFGNKRLNSNKLLLIESDKLLYNENKLASTFNKYSDN